MQARKQGFPHHAALVDERHADCCSPAPLQPRERDAAVLLPGMGPLPKANALAARLEQGHGIDAGPAS